MDEQDLKAIDNLLKLNLKTELKKELEPLKSRLNKVEGKLDKNTVSIMKIEQKIDAALELRMDVSELRTTVKDHETRLEKIETTLPL